MKRIIFAYIEKYALIHILFRYFIRVNTRTNKWRFEIKRWDIEALGKRTLSTVAFFCFFHLLDLILPRPETLWRLDSFASRIRLIGLQYRRPIYLDTAHYNLFSFLLVCTELDRDQLTFDFWSCRDELGVWLCGRARLRIIQLSCCCGCSKTRRWLHCPMLSRCILFLRMEHELLRMYTHTHARACISTMQVNIYEYILYT